MRRTVPLAALAESGTGFDGCGDGTGRASSRLSLWVPNIQTVAQHCRVLHHKTVRQGAGGSGSWVTDHAWRTCGNGRRGYGVYNG